MANRDDAYLHELRIQNLPVKIRLGVVGFFVLGVAAIAGGLAVVYFYGAVRLVLEGF